MARAPDRRAMAGAQASLELLFGVSYLSVMRTNAPALLPIFRSQAQADILTWLYLHPDRGFNLTELADRAGVSLPTVHREAERLVESGLVTQTRLGRNRMLGANMSHPVAEWLARLLEVTFGPSQIVAEEFADVPGADETLIFGSWAARSVGQRGHAPNDIDVMVVGDEVDRSEMYAAADRAEQRLGIPVNPVMRTHGQWDDPSDLLSAQLRSQPLVVATASEKAV